MVSGHQWFVNGELQFPKTDKTAPDVFYRTVGGPAVPTSAVCYARSDHNTALALRRLTGKREPLIVGYHEHLRRQQEQFLVQHASFYEHLRDRYSRFLVDFEGVDAEAEMHYADPHKKRDARIDAWAKLNESGARYYDKVWVGRNPKKMLQVVTAKMKSEEYAKYQKKPRMILDISVQGSLVGFRSMELIKKCQEAVRIEYNGGLFIFVKEPHPEVLSEVFQLHLSPPGRFVYTYYSDDAIFRIGITMWLLNRIVLNITTSIFHRVIRHTHLGCLPRLKVCFLNICVVTSRH